VTDGIPFFRWIARRCHGAVLPRRLSGSLG
jgi:hypothetical protein